MRRTSLLVGAVAVLITIAHQAEGAFPAPEGKSKVNLVVEPGLFGGIESEIKGYEESLYRVHTELGLELRWQIPNSRLSRSVGLLVSSSLGRSDWRFSLGPRGTLPITEDWALQGSVGPLASTREAFNGLGVQTRIGANYRDWVCLSLLYQTLDYTEYSYGDGGWQGPRDRSLTSFYGGIMVTGRPGLYSGLVVAGVGIGYAIVVLASLLRGPW